MPVPAVTYTDLLSDREFRGLWTSFATLVAGSSLGSLALATLVQEQTGSPLLTALSMFGPTLATALGASTAMSLADTARPRRLLVRIQLVVAALVLAQALPIGPVAIRLVLIVVVGLLMSVAAGIRFGLLAEIVPDEHYATARSLLNVATGAMQIVGFASAAVLLSWFTPRQLFVADAALITVSALTVYATTREHSTRPTPPPSLAQTVRTNTWMVRQHRLRPLLVCLWIPNGLVVGCEALFVPYAGERAGVLFVAGAAGMLAGDLAMGRLVSRRQRTRLSPWLRTVLAVPFLAFVLEPDLPTAAALVALATLGYSGSLALQEQLVRLTPEEVRGQVQGVEAAGRRTMQGVGALIAGSVAEVLSPGLTMSLLASASLVVTLVFWRGVHRSLTHPAPAGGG
ncbi:MAG: MFS transporter [Dermatophilaceae bacterium]